jgi:hypothetical protein
MAKLKRKLIETTVIFEQTTEELSKEQLSRWNSSDEEKKQEVESEVSWEAISDKVITEVEPPTLQTNDETQ